MAKNWECKYELKNPPSDVIGTYEDRQLDLSAVPDWKEEDAVNWMYDLLSQRITDGSIELNECNADWLTDKAKMREVWKVECHESD